MTAWTIYIYTHTNTLKIFVLRVILSKKVDLCIKVVARKNLSKALEFSTDVVSISRPQRKKTWTNFRSVKLAHKLISVFFSNTQFHWQRMLPVSSHAFVLELGRPTHDLVGKVTRLKSISPLELLSS